jgi:hypothetical protein
MQRVTIHAISVEKALQKPRRLGWDSKTKYSSLKVNMMQATPPRNPDTCSEKRFRDP